VSRDYQIRISEMVCKASVAAQHEMVKLARAGIQVPLVLCYKPCAGSNDGELRMVPDGSQIPDGFERGCEDLLPTSLSYFNYTGWIRSRVARLPILGSA